MQCVQDMIPIQVERVHPILAKSMKFLLLEAYSVQTTNNDVGLKCTYYVLETDVCMQSHQVIFLPIDWGYIRLFM